MAKMSFLRRVAGRSVRDRVGSSVTREELGVETLLLSIERSQLRWLIDFIVLINVIHFLMIDSSFFFKAIKKNQVAGKSQNVFFQSEL